jgi:Na+/proline symporter/signal transduction histidine kinase
MLLATTLLLSLIVFIAVLALFARWLEDDSSRSKMAEHPVIFALALTVYCTSWTFYGAVGSASNSGLLFLTIYLGPTLAIFFWSRKVIRLKEHFRFTSVADFLSTRYGASQVLAALATLVAALATIPYAALQLESIIHSFKTVSIGGSLFIDLLLVSLVIVMSIVVGSRRLSPTKRNPGLMLILAIFGAIKLIAFLAVGSLVTWNLFYGFDDLFVRATKVVTSVSDDIVTWNTHLFLAMMAFLFLPHQFHVGVVECSSEKQLAKASWLLPLYFILLTIFVVPIAVAAQTYGLPVKDADTYVLMLPLAAGWPDVSLLVFLGGFVAGFGMIVISTITLSTMVANHIVLPFVQWRKGLDRFGRRLLLIRWIVITLIVLAGYGFQRLVSHSTLFVDLGVVTFVGIAQFAPAAIGGLFWRSASSFGAIAGLAGGSILWSYTLLYPMVARGIGFQTIQSSLLAPESLLGVTALPPVAHSVFWSLIVNITLYVLLSSLCPPNSLELQRAEVFMGRIGALPATADEEASIESKIKQTEICRVISQFLDSLRSVEIVAESVAENSLIGKKLLSVVDLAALVDSAERRLAGSIGGAAARHAFEEAKLFSDQEQSKLALAYGSILSKLAIPPGELAKLVDHHKEKQLLLQRHVEQLKDEIHQRQLAEDEARLRQEQLISAHKMVALGTLVSGIAHEINNPNNYITLNSSLLAEVWKDLRPLLDEVMADYSDYCVAGMEYEELCEEVPRLCDGIGEGAAHINRIVSNLRNYVQPSGPSTEETDLCKAINSTVDLVGATIRKSTGRFKVDIAPNLPLVHMSPRDIEVIVVNLLQNACQSLSSREESVTIGLAVNEATNDIVLTVSDEGCGIPENVLPQVKDPFFTTRRESGQTGLGLSVCQSIVQSHGGKFTISSAVGKGTTVNVTLPIACDKEESEKNQ